MAEKGTTATVHVLPMCDICTANGEPTIPAQYDAKTKSGPWAHLCLIHYTLHAAYPTLGTGKGQKLVLEENTYREETPRDAYYCPTHGMSHPIVAHWECYEEHMARIIEAASA